MHISLSVKHPTTGVRETVELYGVSDTMGTTYKRFRVVGKTVYIIGVSGADELLRKMKKMSAAQRDTALKSYFDPNKCPLIKASAKEEAQYRKVRASLEDRAIKVIKQQERWRELRKQREIKKAKSVLKKYGITSLD